MDFFPRADCRFKDIGIPLACLLPSVFIQLNCGAVPWGFLIG